MRIIAGTVGGRRLVAPKGASTRPTTDRVREALFSILGAPPAGTRVLDLFAGAGSLGFEALSRGAASARFVDSARSAIRCLRQNADALGFADRSEICAGDVSRELEHLERRAKRAGSADEAPRFDWVFADPPYATELASTVLELLSCSALLSPSAVVVVEHDRRKVPNTAYGSLRRVDERRYGDTELSFYRRSERE